MTTTADGKLPPGPGFSSLRQALQLARAPYAFVRQQTRRYGDLYTIRLPQSPPAVVTSHPELVHWMFTMDPQQQCFSEQPLPVNAGRRSLLFLDGDEHKLQRKLLTPAFHGPSLRAQADTMRRHVDAELDRWPRGTRFSLFPRVQRLTLDLLLTTMLGPTAAQDQGLRQLALHWTRRSTAPWLLALSLAVSGNRLRGFFADQVDAELSDKPERWRRPWQRLGKDKAMLVRRLKDAVQTCRKQDSAQRSDVLAMLVNSRYDSGEAVETEQIIDHLTTFLVAGQDATSHALCWLIHLLHQHPVACRTARESALACGNDALKLAKAPYLDACARESMRRRPVVPFISRILRSETSIRNWTLPAGSILWADTYSLHHDPSLWSQPKMFQPERFLQNSPSPEHFFPLGGGRRRCIGAAFASFYINIFIGRFLQRFVAQTPDTTSAQFRGLLVAPANGLPLAVECRS